MEEDEVYSTHMQDQIDAAQEEQERRFVERAQQMGVDDPIVVPDEVFEDSYFSSVIPWLADYSLRDEVVGCPHSNNPQPLWVFFDNSLMVNCESCAQVVHAFKTIQRTEPESHCDICEEITSVRWSYASYEYFTIAGIICQNCHDAHRISLELPLD